MKKLILGSLRYRGINCFIIFHRFDTLSPTATSRHLNKEMQYGETI